jgi:hypothetical protein
MALEVPQACKGKEVLLELEDFQACLGQKVKMEPWVLQAKGVFLDTQVVEEIRVLKETKA